MEGIDKMLHSKSDFVNCLERIIAPLKDYYTPGCAGIKCGNTGVNYGEKTARMEGFARVLWGLGPLWGGGENIDGFDSLYLEGIINGTDPEHPEYWGVMKKADQMVVETAAMGLALILAPHKVWDPLTDKQKDNLHNWLRQVNTTVIGDNNWKFFPVLVNLGLKTVGASFDKNIVEHGKERFDAFYRGSGWYSDGVTDQGDYYIAFAIHFYSLIYAKVMEKEDPDTSARYKERATEFAKDFIYWFAEDGSALAFGRSLTYRFAQCCFWSACVFAEIEPFPIGVMKGIIVRNLEWWLSRPIFDNGGILSIGYAYPNLNMAEHYNGFGSPYWALKSFLFLALPEDHEFFSTKALPLPELDSIHPIPEAKMVIQRINGNVIALTSGQWARWNPTHCAEKYSKFAYSSKYAFSVPRSVAALKQSGGDSMLVFDIDGLMYVRRKCANYSIDAENRVHSLWSPCRGIDVQTCITPTADGHVRTHIINSDIECIAYDCGFSTPADCGGKIEGDGEVLIVQCESNTNLIHPYTQMPAVKYIIPKGTVTITTRVVYPD